MSATPPAPAPAARPRPAAAWLAFSAKMTAQVPAIAGRPDLTVTVAPGAGRGAPACFIPASAEIEVNGDHLPAWDEGRGRYYDSATGELLPTWDEALDAIGPNPIGPPVPC